MQLAFSPSSLSLPSLVGWSRTGSGGGGAAPSDPYFDSVTSLLHFDGNLTDQKGLTWTAAGNASATGTAKFGSNSLALDGAGDYLSANSSIFDLVNTDGTIEAWVYRAAGQLCIVCCLQNGNTTGDTSHHLYVNGSDQLCFDDRKVGHLTSGATLVPSNTWTHVAWSRSGGNDRIYIGGVKVGEAAQRTMNSGKLYCLVGASFNTVGAGPIYTNGRIDEFRITKGVARYTADFTPPTAAFPDAQDPLYDAFYSKVVSLIHFDGNLTDQIGHAWTAAGDAAANGVAKFGSNSLALDGTGDYISTIYSTTAFDWWTDDFSIEMWVNPTDLSKWSYSNGSGQITPNAIGNMDANGVNYWSFGPINDGKVRFLYYNGNGQLVTSTATVTEGQWNFIALKKTSAGIEIIVNSTGMTPVAISGTPQSSAAIPLAVGLSWNNVAYNALGLIDDIRITKGADRTITVPTAAFPDQ